MTKIHTSSKREMIAAHNEGFLEGMCHVIDELREIAKAERLAKSPSLALVRSTDPGQFWDSAADRLEATLFAPQSPEGGP